MNKALANFFSAVKKLTAKLAPAALLVFSMHVKSVFADEQGPRQAMGVSTEQARELDGVGITEHLGGELDLNLEFKNEKGEMVKLSQYVNGTKPVILSPVYFSCPGLCNYHLNGVIEALKTMDWSVGKEFDVIAISFDARENDKADLAANKKANYMKAYSRPGTEDGFHFMTGTTESINKLTDSVGFKFKWNEEQQEWAHASAAIVLTPQGKISRYLPGILFETRDVKLALNEAANGQIGTIVDRLVLYCFHYDPHLSKYTVAAVNLMKVGGALIILVLGCMLIPFWSRSRKEKRKTFARSES